MEGFLGNTLNIHFRQKITVHLLAGSTHMFRDFFKNLIPSSMLMLFMKMFVIEIRFAKYRTTSKTKHGELQAIIPHRMATRKLHYLTPKKFNVESSTQ